jgi:hypothetical protein
MNKNSLILFSIYTVILLILSIISTPVGASLSLPLQPTMKPHIENVASITGLPSWKWSKGFGGSDYDNGCYIAVDIVGNTYVTGTFIDDVTFGDFTLSSPWNYNVFVVKLARDGTCVWAACSEGFWGGGHFVQGMAVDFSGNVYITGSFSTNITFGSTTLEGYQGNVYVAKLGRTGEWQWAAAAGRTSKLGWADGWGVTVDVWGNVYVTGWFFNTITFGKTNLTGSNTHENIFVAKLSHRGVWRWAIQTNTDLTKGYLYSFSIDADLAGNVYVTGFFHGTVSFGSTNLTCQLNDANAFVAKVSPLGKWKWATQAEGTPGQCPFGVTVDVGGNIYLVGYFVGSSTFGTTTLTGSNYTIFVAKMDRTGAWQWAASAGGANMCVGIGIALDLKRNIYITGWFQGTCTFGDTLVTCHPGGADVFIASLTPSGSWKWATNAGGTGLTGGRGIAVGLGGSIVATGSFQGSATFGDTTLVSNGYDDVFVARLK